MIVLTLIIVLCLIFLSILVSSQGVSKAPNKALLLSVALLGVWMMMVLGLQAVFDSGHEHNFQLVYSRAVFAVGVLSLLSLVWFVATLLSMEKKTRARLQNILLVLGGVIFLLCMSPYIIADATLQESSVMPIPHYGILMPVYVTVLAAAIGAVLYMVLYGSAKEDEHYRRQQIRIVGVTIFLAMISGIITNLIVPWFTGDAGSSLFMAISIIILISGLSYAIIRHGLFDIKLAAVRSVAYLMSLLALAAIYYTAAYFISITIFREGVTTTFSVSPINIFLALILAFIFQPIKHFFDQATDKIFYRDRYDSEAFYARLSEILTAESTDLRKFLSRIAEEVGTTLRAEVAFLQVQWGHHHASAGKKGHATFSDSDIGDIRMYVLENQCDIIVADTLPEKDPIRRLLSEHAIAIAIPLVQKNTVFGYLFLGNRWSGEYTTRDKKVLETISNELVVAVQNALSLQEIKDFNVHLQQRVEAATHELVASNEKLKRLDVTKDEFLSMASHQLRTPLTSVKGYISMVLEGDAGKITPMQKQLLGEAFTSSERMVHLIGDFLNVSRLQTGKFVLDQSMTNLADLIAEEVDGLKVTAKSRSLKLQYRKPSSIPLLYIDSGKIHQVIMNFIDNAIYYSTEDSAITVKLGLEGGYVVFTVHDTGIGVPKSEQSQLFTKFFRATNAKRQRPDGTGIGLYLAKKVIDAHDGTMVFESREGKGSIFGFRLPIKKLSEHPAETPAGTPSKK